MTDADADADADAGPDIDAWTNRIHTGDAFDVLATLPPDSVHAIVTDPPYGLAFMGKSWDDFDPREYQDWCERWATAAKRVLKPGGHLIAFSGNRTHHRLFTGVEDAGYTIRDTLTWHYAGGFPVGSLDVSKAIDEQADAEREVVDHSEYGAQNTEASGWVSAVGTGIYDGDGDAYAITAPATDAAERWDGWKTRLKPATEFAVLARNPLREDTVAENVRTHGTGALNIDGCAIGTESVETLGWRQDSGMMADADPGGLYDPTDYDGEERTGRYPANVLFDAAEAERLDHRNEATVSSGGSAPARQSDTWTGAGMFDADDDAGHASANDGGLGDYGGPSRYFFTAKASQAERTHDGTIANDHPTVKPLDLCTWLVRLVSAPDQRVLDPFTGSGTIPLAAKRTGRQFIGIERDPEWADVARARTGLTPEDPSHVRPDADAQTGLDRFA